MLEQIVEKNQSKADKDEKDGQEDGKHS